MTNRWLKEEEVGCWLVSDGDHDSYKKKKGHVDDSDLPPPGGVLVVTVSLLLIL